MRRKGKNMKRTIALVMTVLMMCSMPVMAAQSPSAAEAAKAAAEAAKAASEAAKAASDAAKRAADATVSASDASKAASEAAKTAGDAAKKAGEATKSAGDASKSAADAAKAAADAVKAATSAKSGDYYAGPVYYGNVDNSVHNNYTYKITVKSSGDKTPKVVIKKEGSSSGGSNVSVAEPPYINTVLKAPGLDCVVPVGQGGKLVICGCKTRATFVMRETTSAKVSSAKILAAQIGGVVKNVVETYAPGVRFGSCQVDFKVYGCKTGDQYKVYQMGANGTWQEVKVDEIRDGHIICTVYKTGTFAFIKMN